MTRIRGTTQLTGLIGWPVDHSLSPPMHNAAFEALGLDWVYVAMPVRPESLERAVRGLTELGFRGFNVTIPHKEQVLALLDEVTAEARAIGAVNTVVIREGRTAGHNTDVDGFVTPMTVEAELNLDGNRAVILGAGGVSRAIAAGCARLGVVHLTLTDIDLPRAHRLRNDLRRLPACPEVTVVEAGSPALRAAVDGAALVANASPVGMKDPGQSPIALDWLHDGINVFDAVYTHGQTALVAEASRRGGAAIGGLRMLLHQGAKAFSLWTGHEPDIAVMDRAIQEARRA